MSVFVLVTLITAAFVFQHRIDVRAIEREARERGWSAPQIAWAPFSPGWAMRSRQARTYWLDSRGDDGRHERRLCVVDSTWLVGSTHVMFEALRAEATGAAASSITFGRLAVIALFALVGGAFGAALGIGGSLVVFPTSNIAPAYGILLGGPCGFVAGALVGALRGRRAVST